MNGQQSAPGTQRLRVEVRPRVGDIAVVALDGEADLHTAPILREGLAEAIEGGTQTVIVDLTGVSFVDSMMLSVLLGATRQTRLRGTVMRIVVDDPHVRRIFEMTLLDRVLDIYPDLELALAGRPTSGV